MFSCIFLCFALLFNPHMPLIEEAPVIATVANDGYIYGEKELQKPLSKVYKDDKCEILEDFSMQIYKISHNGHIGWLSHKNLIFPEEKAVDKTLLSKSELENFVNSRGFTSKTDYLILTEISRQKTYIFHKNNGWKLVKTFDCSTGRNTSPTTRGIFEIKDRGGSFYSERLKSGALYWLRFNGNYLLHSTPVDKNKNIIEAENRVGERISQGCVRFLVDDIKWIYENIPDETAVVVI